jgi:serine/threonine protein kinase
MLDLHEPISERYHLQQHLHHGSMSDVYLAYDEHEQSDVAIKLVCNDQTESSLRLQSEIRALRTLSHDHILPILDHGECNTYRYLVMPYMQQGTLLKRLSTGRLTEAEAGSILTQVTSALQFAHDHGIIHRDIKPSNILFAGNQAPHVYLADFGLAKALGKGSDLTQTGCLIGTPEYMAPELIDKPESVQSDIYALGILLYHMLTGHPPFRGNSPIVVLWKHLRELPVPPSRLNPAITPSIEHVILNALHKDPQRRFPGAISLAQAYANALQSTQHAKVLTVFPKLETEPAPEHIPLKKIHTKLVSATLLTTAPIQRRQNHRFHFQRAIVSLALVAMFIIPLSLGFLLGRERTQIAVAFSAGTQFASTLHQASHGPTPRPTQTIHQTTQTVYPLSGKAIPKRPPPASHHKHKHKHNHENGNDHTDVAEVKQALFQSV